MKLTRDEPGYYSDMLKAIAVMENTEYTKRITFDSLDKARKAKYKLTSMLFTIDGSEIMPVKCEVIKGGIQTLFFGNFTMPLSEYIGKISIIENKQLKDYQIKPRNDGSYKNCEGAGWYSMANLYELNGKFYTDAY